MMEFMARCIEDRKLSIGFWASYAFGVLLTIKFPEGSVAQPLFYCILYVKKIKVDNSEKIWKMDNNKKVFIMSEKNRKQEEKLVK